MPNLSDYLGSSIRNRQVFTSSDTWSVPLGVKFVDVVVVGGGGSGALSEDVSGSWFAPGSGGCAGDIVQVKDYYVGGESSITVTVGAGGTAPVTAPNDGNAGGDSSFGDIIASGGEGGYANGDVDSSSKFINYFAYEYDSDNIGAVPICEPRTIGDDNYSLTTANGGTATDDSTTSKIVNGANNIGSVGGTTHEDNGGGGAGGYLGDGGDYRQNAPTANTGAGGGGGRESFTAGNGASGIVIVYWN